MAVMSMAMSGQLGGRQSEQGEGGQAS